MNRYYGNGGQRKRVYVPDMEPLDNNVCMSESPTSTISPQIRKKGTMLQHSGQKQPPNPFSALGSGLGGILSKIGIAEFEAEDWILLLILYLMYRESGDEELLFMLGAMFLN